jgi:hypothetical protein
MLFPLTFCIQFFLCVAASKELKTFRTQLWDLSPASAAPTAACSVTQAAAEVAATKDALLQAKRIRPQQVRPSVLL